MSTHVVVLGAGYTGLVAAKLADRLPGVRVTLVNERDRFVERVRLHQWASGQALPPRPLSALLAGTGVDLVVDRVESLDPDRRTVSLRGAGPLGYDLLVNALGSRSGRPPGVGPGPLPDHLHSVNEADHGDRLRARLAGARSVAVVGGGLTGLEAVTELAETRPELEVHLVTGRAAGADLSARGARYLRSVLADLGVRVHEGSPVAEVPPEGPVRADGRLVPADTTVWTAGFRVPELAGAAGLEVTGTGRMVVDEGLRSVSHPEVYGVGDAAAARRSDGRELRMACATGIPGAQHAVRSMAARLAGRPVRPMRFRYFNQCLSLGRRRGLIQFVRADDSPVERILTGRAAAVYKEAMVRGAYLAQRHPWIPVSA
ncbi:NAD(P)/FAD-dependent oxidoreductase [Nocardiopsis sp. NPDC057823]|uniref:NAD(P)/FAD-dependent oxidoreductase n=1 Tax=Nocardiopsis sp. NPDC057823 TaxID=3346256 RepID=UPI00366D950F